MPSSLTNREITRKVQPVRVALRCKVEGCAGLMGFTGHAVTMGDTSCEHECSMCGIIEWAKKRYPRIEYVDV